MHTSIRYLSIAYTNFEQMRRAGSTDTVHRIRAILTDEDLVALRISYLVEDRDLQLTTPLTEEGIAKHRDAFESFLLKGLSSLDREEPAEIEGLVAIVDDPDALLLAHFILADGLCASLPDALICYNAKAGKPSDHTCSISEPYGLATRPAGHTAQTAESKGTLPQPERILAALTADKTSESLQRQSFHVDCAQCRTCVVDYIPKLGGSGDPVAWLRITCAGLSEPASYVAIAVLLESDTGNVQESLAVSVSTHPSSLSAIHRLTSDQLGKRIAIRPRLLKLHDLTQFLAEQIATATEYFKHPLFPWEDVEDEAELLWARRLMELAQYPSAATQADLTGRILTLPEDDTDVIS